MGIQLLLCCSAGAQVEDGAQLAVAVRVELVALRLRLLLIRVEVVVFCPHESVGYDEGDAIVRQFSVLLEKRFTVGAALEQYGAGLLVDELAVFLDVGDEQRTELRKLETHHNPGAALAEDLFEELTVQLLIKRNDGTQKEQFERRISRVGVASRLDGRVDGRL